MTFVTPYDSYQTLILGIKLQRKHLNISLDVSVNNTHWNYNQYAMTFDGITDLTQANMFAYKIY